MMRRYLPVQRCPGVSGACAEALYQVVAIRFKKTLSSDQRMNQLVLAGDVEGAIQTVRGSMQLGHCTMALLGHALYLCEQKQKVTDALALVQDMHRHMPHATWDETTLAIVLRLYRLQGDLPAGIQVLAYLLQQSPVSVDRRAHPSSSPSSTSTTNRSMLKRRHITPFLQLCHDQRNRNVAFAAYEEAVRQRGMELGISDYEVLVLLCMEVGEPINTLQHFLQDIASHITEVPMSLAVAIVAWHQGARCTPPADQVLPPAWLHGFASPVPCDAEQHPSIPRAYCCGSCGRLLEGFPFTAECKALLLKDIREKLVPQKCKTSRTKLAFRYWCRYVEQHPCDIFIDGANVGYYGLSSWYHLTKKALLLHKGVPERRITPEELSFSHMKYVDVPVNFAMIQLAVQEAQQRGLRPLVVLHERHLESHNLVPSDAAIVAAWRKNGWVYATPTGLNDDICWLFGAVSLTHSTTDASSHPVFVLTNDKMRDHHFQMLSQRSFTRWRDVHRISFRCTREQNETQLHFDMPPSFTRCLQQPQTHSSHAAAGTKHWHIPIQVDDDEASGKGEVPIGLETNSDVSQPSSRWLCLSLAAAQS